MPKALLGPRARYQTLLARHGRAALSAQAAALEGLDIWFASEASAVAYHRGHFALVALGPPVGPLDQLAAALQGFVAFAAQTGRRAVVFGLDEGLAREAGLDWLACGQDPSICPASWLASLRAQERRSLSRQLRRAARTTVVHRVSAEAAALAGAKLLAAWQAQKELPPMQFAATVSLRQSVEGARHYLATSKGQAVALAVVLPSAHEGTWLLEQLWRADRAPNGTAEAVAWTVASDLGEVARLSFGFVPLAGAGSWQMRLARHLGRGLYSFAGLHAFRRHLAPQSWQTLGIAYPRGEASVPALIAVGMAFIGERPLAFLSRLLWRGPKVVRAALALALVPWTMWLARLPDVPYFYSHATHVAWIAFDTLLCAALGRFALRPTARLAHGLGLVILLDATLTITEHAVCGAASLPEAAWRLVSALSPAAAACVAFGTARRLEALERSLANAPAAR